jgi:RimJ/RimL family protein N-acetyltransferase
MSAVAIATTGLDFVTRLPETIRTARLGLRAPNRNDVAALTRLASNQNILKWLPRLPNPYTEADAIAFVDTIARGPGEHAFSILTDDGGFIGTIGLHLDGEGPAELGYWIGEPYWGLGYASEATVALLAAVDAAGCTRVDAWTLSGNAASQRVLEKSDFVETKRVVGECGPLKRVDITYFRREPVR